MSLTLTGIIKKRPNSFLRNLNNIEPKYGHYMPNLTVEGVYGELLKIGEDIAVFKQNPLKLSSLINMVGELNPYIINELRKYNSDIPIVSSRGIGSTIYHYDELSKAIRPLLSTRENLEVKECKQWWSNDDIYNINNAISANKNVNRGQVIKSKVPEYQLDMTSLQPAHVMRFRRKGEWVYYRLSNSNGLASVEFKDNFLRYVVPTDYNKMLNLASRQPNEVDNSLWNQPLEYFAFINKLGYELGNFYRKYKTQNMSSKTDAELKEIVDEPFKKCDEYFSNGIKDKIGTNTGSYGEYHILKQPDVIQPGYAAFRYSMDMNFLGSQARYHRIEDVKNPEPVRKDNMVTYYLMRSVLEKQCEEWWRGGKLVAKNYDTSVDNTINKQHVKNNVNTTANEIEKKTQESVESGDIDENIKSEIGYDGVSNNGDTIDEYGTKSSVSTAPNDYTDTEYMRLNLPYSKFSDMYQSVGLSSPLVTYGIGGMPASYLATTDPPAWEGDHISGMGFTYMNHYIRYGNFISFQPSITRFNFNFYGGNSTLEMAQSVFNTMMGGQLTSLEPRLTDYWLQVSRMCRVAIYLMGIQDSVIEFQTGVSTAHTELKKAQANRGVSFENINRFRLGDLHADVWAAIGCGFASVVGAGVELPDVKNRNGIQGEIVGDEYDYGNIAFLCNGPIEATEDLSNQIGESAIKELFDKYLGDTRGYVKEFITTVFAKQGTVSGTNFGGTMYNLFTGNYLIPKIWQGSEFSQSYGCEFKFTSASGDPVATFLNVYFPLIKLMALATPESTGGLIYTPWICSVHSTGNINIDYGMINSISITKDQTSINDHGQATSIDVKISIMNLRPWLYQEKPRWLSLSSKHSASITQFIATLVGTNLSTGIKRTALDSFKDDIGKLNYAEQVSVTPRFIKMGIHRFIGRASRYLHNLNRHGQDRWASISALGSQFVLGQDAYDKTLSNYNK